MNEKYYAIIAHKGGEVSISIPIMSEDDPDVMATFESVQAAKDFTRNNILCQSSVNLIINLHDPTEIYLH